VAYSRAASNLRAASRPRRAEGENLWRQRLVSIVMWSVSEVRPDSALSVGREGFWTTCARPGRRGSAEVLEHQDSTEFAEAFGRVAEYAEDSISVFDAERDVLVTGFLGGEQERGGAPVATVGEPFGKPADTERVDSDAGDFHTGARASAGGVGLGLSQAGGATRTGYFRSRRHAISVEMPLQASKDNSTMIGVERRADPRVRVSYLDRRYGRSDAPSLTQTGQSEPFALPPDVLPEQHGAELLEPGGGSSSAQMIVVSRSGIVSAGLTASSGRSLR
jgi:hypothetical protein